MNLSKEDKDGRKLIKMSILNVLKQNPQTTTSNLILLVNSDLGAKINSDDIREFIYRLSQSRAITGSNIGKEKGWSINLRRKRKTWRRKGGQSEKVITYLKSRKTPATKKEIQEATEVSKKSIYKILSRLVKSELVVQSGMQRKCKYLLTQPIDIPSKSSEEIVTESRAILEENPVRDMIKSMAKAMKGMLSENDLLKEKNNLLEERNKTLQEDMKVLTDKMLTLTIPVKTIEEAAEIISNEVGMPFSEIVERFKG